VSRWQRAGLRSRVALAYVVLVLTGLLGVAFSGITFAELSEARVTLTERLTPASIALGRWREAMLDQERGLRGLILSQEPTLSEPYARGAGAAADAEATVRAELDGDPLLGEVESAAEATARWQERVAEPLAQAAGAGAPAQEGRAALEAGTARFDAARAQLDALQVRIDERRAIARDDLASSSGRLAAALAVVTVLVGAGIAATWVALNRWVMTPLAALGGEARQVTAGDVRREIPATGPPELQALGRDVEGMRLRIVEELAQVEEARAALEAQAADLARSNEELEQFAYVASHDLQEPLRKVTGFCQLLERRYKGQLDERADEYIAYAVDGAKRMQLLINDLLSFSRVGRTTDRFVDVDLAELAGRVQELLRDEIDASGATVNVHPLPVVQGDPTLLEMLLQNLIANALKFRSDAPPEVTITTEQHDEMWHFACVDNGIGIEPQFAERVFVIFQRLNDRGSYAGTGIGLALCRKVVEFHGGTIEVERSEGPGTTIRWTHPVVMAGAEAEQADQGRNPQP